LFIGFNAIFLFASVFHYALSQYLLTVCFNCLSAIQLFCSCVSHHWTEASLIWTSQQQGQSLEDVKLSVLLYTIQFRFCFIMRLPSRSPSFIPPSSVAIKNQLRRVNIKWQERRCERRESWKIEEFLRDKEKGECSKWNQGKW
jgi:hypothetical protein